MVMTSDMLSLLICLTELRSQDSTRQSTIIFFNKKKKQQSSKKNPELYIIGTFKS